MSKSSSRKGVALAFDLGGTKLNAGLVNHSGEILYQKKYAVDSKRLESILHNSVQEFLEHAKLGKMHVIGCGMASAGPMDIEKGILVNPVNLPGIKIFHMTRVLKSSLRKFKNSSPVYFQNDAMAAAMAEGWKGYASDAKTYICVTLGTGLGSGVIFNGEPLQTHGMGSEWGHAMFGKNSYEEIVCGPAIIRRINSHYNLSLTTLRDLPEYLIQEKDFYQIAFQPVVEALAGFCRSLSLGLNPDVILFSGGVMLVKKYFWKEVQTEYKHQMRDFKQFIKPLKECHFKNNAGLIGAASLVFR